MFYTDIVFSWKFSKGEEKNLYQRMIDLKRELDILQGIAREEQEYCRNVKGEFRERYRKVPGMWESCKKVAGKFWESCGNAR